MPNAKLKRAARHLLASTCLVAGAEAATVTEGTDFSNSGPGAALPTGTNRVIGTLNSVGPDLEDFFQFTGLNPGSLTFTASQVISGDMGENAVVYLNSSNVILGFNSTTITVPGDGIVRVNVTGYANNGGLSYDVSFPDTGLSGVPEPGTSAAMATGLAAAALAASRRKKEE